VKDNASTQRTILPVRIAPQNTMAPLRRAGFDALDDSAGVADGRRRYGKNKSDYSESDSEDSEFDNAGLRAMPVVIGGVPTWAVLVMVVMAALTVTSFVLSILLYVQVGGSDFTTGRSLDSTTGVLTITGFDDVNGNGVLDTGETAVVLLDTDDDQASIAIATISYILGGGFGAVSMGLESFMGAEKYAEATGAGEFGSTFTLGSTVGPCEFDAATPFVFFTCLADFIDSVTPLLTSLLEAFDGGACITTHHEDGFSGCSSADNDLVDGIYCSYMSVCTDLDGTSVCTVVDRTVGTNLTAAQSDHANCGNCGTACAYTEECVDNTCVAARVDTACGAAQTNCTASLTSNTSTCNFVNPRETADYFEYECCTLMDGSSYCDAASDCCAPESTLGVAIEPVCASNLCCIPDGQLAIDANASGSSYNAGDCCSGEAMSNTCCAGTGAIAYEGADAQCCDYATYFVPHVRPDVELYAAADPLYYCSSEILNTTCTAHSQCEGFCGPLSLEETPTRGCCYPQGSACTRHTDCCHGMCMDSKCGPRDAETLVMADIGEACVDHNDCISGNCSVGLLCTNPDYGDSCNLDLDCQVTHATAVCMGIKSDSAACCELVGGACSTHTDCCPYDLGVANGANNTAGCHNALCVYDCGGATCTP